jgi:hypothetical protein
MLLLLLIFEIVCGQQEKTIAFPVGGKAASPGI